LEVENVRKVITAEPGAAAVYDEKGVVHRQKLAAVDCLGCLSMKVAALLAPARSKAKKVRAHWIRRTLGTLATRNR